MKLPHWLYWLPFGTVPRLDPARFSDADSTARFFLLDVRTRTEWRQSHIPGSCNIPLHRFQPSPELLRQIGAKPVLCICLSAHRSTPVVRRLRAAGIEAYELKGGMLNWWRHRLPTEQGE